MPTLSCLSLPSSYKCEAASPRLEAVLQRGLTRFPHNLSGATFTSGIHDGVNPRGSWIMCLCGGGWVAVG